MLQWPEKRFRVGRRRSTRGGKGGVFPLGTALHEGEDGLLAFQGREAGGGVAVQSPAAIHEAARAGAASLRRRPFPLPSLSSRHRRRSPPVRQRRDPPPPPAPSHPVHFLLTATPTLPSSSSSSAAAAFDFVASPGEPEFRQLDLLGHRLSDPPPTTASTTLKLGFLGPLCPVLFPVGHRGGVGRGYHHRFGSHHGARSGAATVGGQRLLQGFSQ